MIHSNFSIRIPIIALILAAMMSSCCCSSVPSSLIRDQALEQAIREQIGKPQGELTIEDLEGISELRALFADVESIEGLQYCRNLEILSLTSNRISNLAPLKELTQLKRLYLTNNQISNIEHISSLVNLEDLTLGVNHISDIRPLTGLKNLKWLGIEGNMIRDLEPLVLNEGIGEGDVINIADNPLSDDARTRQLQLLEERGVSFINW